jgi:hypothetical protein
LAAGGIGERAGDPGFAQARRTNNILPINTLLKSRFTTAFIRGMVNV